MKKAEFYIGVLALFMVVFGVPYILFAENAKDDEKYKQVKITASNGIVNNALYFSADGKRAVVFNHSMQFTINSWTFLARRLQKLGVASLSIDGGTTADIYGAINYLKHRGYQKFALVGGSAGGRVILNALKEKMEEDVNKVIVLAPMGGALIANENIKLFIIVGKDDPMGMKVYDTNLHAQHLFKGEFKEDIIGRMLDFLVGQQ